MRLNDIVEQCKQDTVQWFPDREYDLPFMVLAAVGEVGELANLVKKVERGTHLYSELRPQMVEEAVDAFIYICNVFNALGADAESHYLTKRGINAQRFGNAGATSEGGSGLPHRKPSTTL